MADNMECVTCGGTNFFKESGYFFCYECQTQSQEIREHVFQEEEAHVNVKSSKKIKKAKFERDEDKITSWECYNIVMCSLTQQLIQLGADRNLKPIVKYLWIRYLEKLEVINLKYNYRPKLALINWKRDAKILYNRTKRKEKKRKRRKSISETSSVSLDTASLRRERSRKKRALAEAQYGEFSQKSFQESSTLHSETLTSLKSSSEKSVNQERPTTFNRYSIIELRKKMSKGHCQRHKCDKEQTMKCHKFTYAHCSKEYRKGIHFVSPIKLYCLLYLGLLINKDKIQLGDFFRFIREGHLNFNKYTELLPEDYLNKFINIKNNTKNSFFSNKLFRITTAKLAKFLNIVKYIPVIDIVELCQRFCKEMNLPGDVFLCVQNLISKTSPRLMFTNKDSIIPNYEGRAMAFIIFVLKLLFGLDGITESELSRYAHLVNSSQISLSKMFNIMKWLEYIGYRRLIVSEYHFPTSYSENSNDINSDLFLQYIKSIDATFENDIKLTKEMNDYKDLLTNLKELEDSPDSYMRFPPSFTPFLEYSRSLSNSINCDKDNILKENFEEHSLDFLLRPNKYLQMVGENVNIKHGGANDNWVIENIKSYRTEKLATRQDHKLIPVEIVPRGMERNIDQIRKSCNRPNKNLDSSYVQLKYEECRGDIFHENEIYLTKISNKVVLNETDQERLQCYNNHFNPYERYWLYLQMNIDLLNKKIRDNFFKKHSNAFQLVFNECARIIEQTVQELLYDFQISELFLVYAATYKDKYNKPKATKLLDNNLQHYITQSIAYW